MTARLIWVTPEAEHHVAFCARVSNPTNQENRDTEAKLLRYCIKNSHWSVFEMASMCIEIVTSRTIARQILRHRSFSFQEFSQRYAKSDTCMIINEARRQDTKNRQNSIDDLCEEEKEWFREAQRQVFALAYTRYEEALEKGVAKEAARTFLPEGNTQSRMYMTGSIRSWITYLQVRLDESTQLEHRMVAQEIQAIFIEQLPVISKALEWTK